MNEYASFFCDMPEKMNGLLKWYTKDMARTRDMLIAALGRDLGGLINTYFDVPSSHIFWSLSGQHGLFERCAQATHLDMGWVFIGAQSASYNTIAKMAIDQGVAHSQDGCCDYSGANDLLFDPFKHAVRKTIARRAARENLNA